MTEILQREAIYLWYYITVLFEQIFRYWAGGVLIGSAISVFAKQSILRWFSDLQDKPIGILGILPASALGVLSPLCMYGTIPIAASFSQKGMKDDWLAAFMMSSILLNPQLIIYSSALGTHVMIIRVISSLIGGILAGIIINLLYTSRKKVFFTFSSMISCSSRDTARNPLVRYLKNVWRNIRATLPYFLFGIILTAAFQRYVPDTLTTALFGRNQAFGVLMAAALGVPLYACGGGTIPLLFDWMARGMSLGSATAFMIAGPGTKITNLGALKAILGFRRFGLYLMYIILLSWIMGLVINLMY